MTQHTYIIAEAGVNHNGDPDLAKKLIDLAKSAGVDAIKFQTFCAENLVTKGAKKAEYQIQTTGTDESQFQMLKRLELSKELHHELLNYTKKLDLNFISTPFDIENLIFLVDELGLDTIKLSSGDLTNAPLLYEVGKRRCRLILSTGMSNMAEIQAALGMLIIGYEEQHIVEPLFEHAMEVYSNNPRHNYLTGFVSLLHCTSEYPASYDDINLLAIETLKNHFQLETGLSDHSEGIIIPIAATARGAAIIEKHITLDKHMPGPDHQASLSPEELHDMVKAIRSVEDSLGNGVKAPCKAEKRNSVIIRKGIYAKNNIKEGGVISRDNIAIKRPESALSPYDYWRCQNRLADKSYEADDALSDIK